jgi:hypothetical protein
MHYRRYAREAAMGEDVDRVPARHNRHREHEPGQHAAARTEGKSREETRP